MYKKQSLVYKNVRTSIYIIIFLLSFSLSGQESPLRSNDSYKLNCSESGVYKLTYDWIITNIEPNPKPGQWQLWTGSPDEYEIPMSIVGIEDGTFDSDDYVLFYVDVKEQAYDPFDANSYVYLVTDIISGIEVGTKIYENPDSLVPIYEHRHQEIYDEALFNLLHEDPVNSGSGQQWVGIEITNNKITDLSPLLNLSSDDHQVYGAEVTVVVRSDVSENIFFTVDGFANDETVRSVELGDVEDEFGRKVTVQISPQLLSSDGPANYENIFVEFLKKSTQAQAWIDEVKLDLTSTMGFSSTQKTFSFANIQSGNVGYIRTNQDPVLWEVSHDGVVHGISYDRTPDHIRFNLLSNASYVVFDDTEDLLTPLSVESVTPLQLSELSSPELLIVYHQEFENEALRLKSHREAYSQLSVLAIEVGAIYDEFSSGRRTPEAIRLFAKQFYDQGQQLKFMLLIGDGSFDYRHIYSEIPDQNFIPTYETSESLDPLESFPTDDYFALLDEADPRTLRGNLDIAVGRLPVRSQSEAEAVITKIIHYDTHASTLGAWRNNIGFFADDEDFNLHIDDADEIAVKTENSYSDYIQQKVYWDAYPQVSTPGGNRYPAANEELNRTIDEGLLVMNYLGHGGALGWSQERVLNTTDIESWTNFNQLPLIVTATCSFTGFDDPNITSAGELAFLNPVGGAVALFTTVRSVYASKNFRLTSAVYDQLFEKVNGEFLTIGEILRQSKNRVSLSDINSRKFLLIGDPSMTLSYPQNQIITKSINDDSLDMNRTDTIGALDRVVLEGIVSADGQEIDTDFSGKLFVTVYDKATEIRTLQNDERSRIRTFNQFNNVIYKGQTEIIDGQFKLDFVIPVDIDYSPGRAKVSYYAESNDGLDASGVFEQLVVAGTSSNPIIDSQGPSISPYLNSRSFLNGDRVNSDPILIVDFSDENGINLSQVAIGHEIVAILDGNTQSTLILNDFFASQSTANSTAGTIIYPMDDLEPGEHSLEIRAFDILNNLTTETISFIVDESLDEQIMDFKVSPNPTYSPATFKLTHSISSVINASIEIFDSAGKLIKIISSARPFISNEIISEWNIRSDRSIITNGVYLCRAKIEKGDGEIAYSNLEKLVILK